MAEPRPGRERPLADAEARRRISEDLDTTMLVEAAAGTGKTTKLIDRIVALLAEGRCDTETMAAVTFTRKAAAELRSRLGVAIERAASEAGEPRRGRLVAARARIERLFVGTIHSFCASLLRKRPVEAGVPLEFEEIEDDADAALRKEAWELHVAALIARDDPVLEELNALGLEVRQLERAFGAIADYPDVSEWPAPPCELPDPRRLLERLGPLFDRIRLVAPTLPPEVDKDKLMVQYRRIDRLIGHLDLGTPGELFEVVEGIQEFETGDLKQKRWPGGGIPAARAELEFWNGFAAPVVPFRDAWLARRYAAALRVLLPCRETYDRLRAERGVLNFADLLIRCAAVLRDRPHVRRAFQEQTTHLLVDEFQDTDPIQAEVMMLLTADDLEERDWRRCRPRPGSLFVVGDPKQSIYRFRRADIVTYGMVRDAIARSGALLALSANFRSTAPVREWVNRAFDETFPEAATAFQAARVPLTGGHAEEPSGAIQGIAKLSTPGELRSREAIVEREAGLVARSIRSALDARATVPRPARGGGGASPAEPEDFLLLARGRKHLAVYARRLQELGIPCAVTGGSAVNDVPELALLARAARAVADPDDPVALLAVLRSELFGVDDATLYAFACAGGRFAIGSTPPELPPGPGRDALLHAWSGLRRCGDWAAVLPPGAALEKMAGELGLLALAGASGEGGDRSGGLATAIELVRAAAGDEGSPAALADALDRLVSGDVKHDAIPARPAPRSAVRVMNLHKAKGLEAPVVYLVDPAGASPHPPRIVVDRSAGRVSGYLTITEQFGDHGSKLLAKPLDWDELVEREQLFLGAEESRLLYVAATRAGSRLVVSLREKFGNENPWTPFEPFLSECPEEADPGPQDAPRAEARAIEEWEPEAAARDIAGRWSGVARPTYGIRAAKTITVRPDERYSSGEHGTEWGSAIHLMLQAAASRPNADLARIGAAAFADLGLPPEGVALATEMVGAVLGSALWARASASTRRLTEIPFQLAVPPGDPLGGALPTLVRGVVDLAFEEDAGWVLVDYKTDDHRDRDLDALVARHTGQLETYAAAWRRITGSPVREIGLYFVRSGRYRALPPGD